MMTTERNEYVFGKMQYTQFCQAHADAYAQESVNMDEDVIDDDVTIKLKATIRTLKLQNEALEAENEFLRQTLGDIGNSVKKTEK
jgi:hypothetical protein